MNESLGRHLWNIPLALSLSEASLKVRRFSSDMKVLILLSSWTSFQHGSVLSRTPSSNLPSLSSIGSSLNPSAG